MDEAQKEQARQHLQGWGPMYALLVTLVGGGSLATLSDNIPVTQKQFTAWTTSHAGGTHQTTSDSIDDITDTLQSMRLEQTRAQLKNAYEDKCKTTDPRSLAYIDKEIIRLEGIYFALTQREYDPPPCVN